MSQCQFELGLVSSINLKGFKVTQGPPRVIYSVAEYVVAPVFSGEFFPLKQYERVERFLLILHFIGKKAFSDKIFSSLPLAQVFQTVLAFLFFPRMDFDDAGSMNKFLEKAFAFLHYFPTKLDTKLFITRIR